MCDINCMQQFLSPEAVIAVMQLLRTTSRNGSAMLWHTRVLCACGMVLTMRDVMRSSCKTCNDRFGRGEIAVAYSLCRT